MNGVHVLSGIVADASYYNASDEEILQGMGAAFELRLNDFTTDGQRSAGRAIRRIGDAMLVGPNPLNSQLASEVARYVARCVVKEVGGRVEIFLDDLDGVTPVPWVHGLDGRFYPLYKVADELLDEHRSVHVMVWSSLRHGRIRPIY